MLFRSEQFPGEVFGFAVHFFERLINRHSADGHGRVADRGGKGVINMKVTKKIGSVVGILSVKEDTDVVIISADGKILRTESSQIRQAGRSTQGVRLVNLDEGDRVAAAGVVPESEIKDEDDAQGDLLT